MAQTVACPQCGKRFLVPETFRGRARCPHCSHAPGEAPPAAAPDRPSRQALPEPPAPAETSTPALLAATAGRAWEQAAQRRRRPRRWPPPPDQRSTAFAEALRRRFARSNRGLWPYLVLMAILALALVLFALLAGRLGGPEAGPDSARRAVTQEVLFVA